MAAIDTLNEHREQLAAELIAKLEREGNVDRLGKGVAALVATGSPQASAYLAKKLPYSSGNTTLLIGRPALQLRDDRAPEVIRIVVSAAAESTMLTPLFNDAVLALRDHPSEEAATQLRHLESGWNGTKVRRVLEQAQTPTPNPSPHTGDDALREWNRTFPDIQVADRVATIGQWFDNPEVLHARHHRKHVELGLRVLETLGTDEAVGVLYAAATNHHHGLHAPALAALGRHAMRCVTDGGDLEQAFTITQLLRNASFSGATPDIRARAAVDVGLLGDREGDAQGITRMLDAELASTAPNPTATGGLVVAVAVPDNKAVIRAVARGEDCRELEVLTRVAGSDGLPVSVRAMAISAVDALLLPPGTTRRHTVDDLGRALPIFDEILDEKDVYPTPFEMRHAADPIHLAVDRIAAQETSKANVPGF